ncbi:MAG: alpha/beta hydrolase, partial [Thermoanaerobaculia bacterium]|nr:alpha/beta hydrolase [Thermoanaerobaculia bacterium]
VAHSLGAAAATIALAGGTAAERAVYLAAAENLDPYVDRFRRELGLSAALVGNVRRRVDRRFGLFRESLRGRTLARALALPLLAFHDADDCEIPAAHSETIVARWVGARLVRTIGLGHRGLLRHEGVVRAAVEHLLSDATAAPEASHPGDG